MKNYYHLFSPLIAFFLATQMGLFSNPMIISPEANGYIRNILLVPFIFFSLSFCILRLDVTLLHFFGRQKILFLFMILALTSISWSTVPDFTLERALMLIAYSMIGFTLGWLFPLDEIIRIHKYSGILVLVSTIFIAVFYRNTNIVYMVEGNKTYWAWRGYFAHKNSLGLSLALGCLALTFTHASTIFKKFNSGVIFIIYIICLLNSRSTTSLVVLIATLAVPIWFKWWHKGTAVRFVMIFHSMLLIVSLLYNAWENLNSIESIDGKALTLTGRTDLWEVFLELIKNNWVFGFGYGGFWGNPSQIANFSALPGPQAMRLIGMPDVNYAHNGLFDVFLNLGIVGLIVMVVFLFVNAKFLYSILNNFLTIYGNNRNFFWPISILAFVFIENITESKLDPFSTNFAPLWVTLLSTIFAAMKESLVLSGKLNRT